MDGGYFNEYSKSFRSAGLVAVIESPVTVCRRRTYQLR